MEEKITSTSIENYSKEMVSKKIEIKAIEVKIGDKEIRLTLEEARVLKEKLEEFCGKTLYINNYPLNSLCNFPAYSIPHEWRPTTL